MNIKKGKGSITAKETRLKLLTVTSWLDQDEHLDYCLLNVFRYTLTINNKGFRIKVQ